MWMEIEQGGSYKNAKLADFEFFNSYSCHACELFFI